MNNITHKSSSLRTATATAIVKLSTQATMDAILQNRVPKGNVLEFARAAGLLAVKKTSDVIPDCHPMPIESAEIQYKLEGLDILIEVTVYTVYKTGVEVEAMHGAAITALTIYDMLKPIDKGIEISSIQLLHKKGGKSDFNPTLEKPLKTAVVVCSDSITAGKNNDTAGKAIMEKLKQWAVEVEEYRIIPDEFAIIQSTALELSNSDFQLVLFTGGTGLSPRDLTPDAITPLLSRNIPGIMEAARNYGQSRTPYAMLSRGVAGFIQNSLVLTLPGSLKGAEESMDALFPYLFHLFRVAEGWRHEPE